MKIAFLGAGSTIFSRNVLGDCMGSQALVEDGLDIALYDIDGTRLGESERVIRAIAKGKGVKARITGYLGVDNRKAALRGADFAVNAVQVGGYDPCTVTDFEIPKKYGLRQTIADTLGIGGIMRALRTIPVMQGFAQDMQEVCPQAWLLNYTNPMAMLTGYMQRYTGVKTVGLCHSVQVCVENLLGDLGMSEREPGHSSLIAGINHMAWLLQVRDAQGEDLYPEIKRRAKEKVLQGGPFHDYVRYDYLEKLGYYCTESSEHNAEYNPFYIKARYPELIRRFQIPLDEYPRRCVKQIAQWEEQSRELLSTDSMDHPRSKEYASHIMEAMLTNRPYKIGGNVLNRGGLIENLPQEACVEVPCLVDASGVSPCRVGLLPLQLAAMNQTNINVQLLTIEAARTMKKEHIYHAAMLDPHTAAELSVDDMVSMVDELIQAHGEWLPAYH
ncbi:MAG: alpha-glucosidase/alpha-galactosidase [Candidatus Limiplasma sp.]|nr:alpha-glucosidase/alpha-galactosidase [Candidatus Limiplasma sp.]